ncbi:fumarylacetoacetate hydrolase family protein [Rheinheimera baltica]|uniref:fumarylacetoacetate hydrolase family protein n=1 Tax=Rheinheimera baltica TaxID=67576 RepID=UPI00040329CF|nr:fumarylacetoacetate hydrolase family protein [Rheinheimera baltica]
MNYQHLDVQGNVIDLPQGKVVCIGQNYQDHIAEMQSKTAPEALFFIKPSTALCALQPGITIPQQQGAVHNETELAVLIAKPLKNADIATVIDAIWGYSLALDLTLRDVQAKLKQLGRPWEIAKGFDNACPVGGFVAKAQVSDPQQLDFSLRVNGEARQQANTMLMIRPVYQLISEMSQHFTLLPGDIILTGTPAGVGPLHSGDELQLQLANLLTVNSKVH